MKTLLILLSFMLYGTIAHADYWYIFDSSNRAVAIIDYEPDRKDLQTRNEFVFKSDKKIDIKEVEFFDNDVRVRLKSQEERNSAKTAEDVTSEMAVVYHLMFENAYMSAIKKGYQFDNLSDHVDEIDKKEKIAKDEQAIDNRIKKEMYLKMKEEGYNFEIIDEEYFK